MRALARSLAPLALALSVATSSGCGFGGDDEPNPNDELAGAWGLGLEDGIGLVLETDGKANMIFWQTSGGRPLVEVITGSYRATRSRGEVGLVTFTWEYSTCTKRPRSQTFALFERTTSSHLRLKLDDAEERTFQRDKLPTLRNPAPACF